ncbi:MAG: SPOR domain-containing protein [Ignavibacteriaceae bacterium]|nr:SPOR domain-containing protein [Ignavibacteriaceae bacterium]
MTTSKKLLVSFAETLGIPESASRIALEMFANSILRNSGFGDQVEVASLGFFSVRQMKSLIEADNSLVNVLLFSEKKISSENNDVLMFFLPNDPNRSISSIDSYLDLSFDKPIINPVKPDEHDFVFCLNTNELKALIESKVEKLFSDSIVHKHLNENEKEYSILQKSNEVEDKEEKIPEKLLEDQSLLRADEKDLAKIFESETKSENPEFVSSDDDILDSDDFEKDEKPKRIFDDTLLENESDSDYENVELREKYASIGEQNQNISVSPSKHTFQNDIDEDFIGEKPKSSLAKKILLISALLLLVGISAAIYFNIQYIQNYISKYYPAKSDEVPDKRTVVTNTIERTSELIMPQPILANDSMLIQPNDSLIISPLVYGNKSDSLTENDTKTKINEIIVSNNPTEVVKVGDNIYKKGNEYYVQVSSWRSRAKAEAEMNKLKYRGYKTNLEIFSSRELGTVFRVQVTGFKTVREANNFLNTNK